MVRRRRRSVRGAHSRSLRRPLRLEPLEERRLLALTVTTNLDVVDLNDGVLSLREAIFVANTAAGPDEIHFDFGHDGPETIVLTQGELTITDSLVITGSGAGLLTIDASGNNSTPDDIFGDGSRVFNVDDGDANGLIDVTIAGLTLTGGDVVDGGGIFSKENLSLVDSVVTGNFATGRGGGVRQHHGSLQLLRTEVSSNRSNVGGGLSVRLAMLDMQDSLVTGNTGQGSGGGVNVYDSTATIHGSTISFNTDIVGGAGGIWARDVELTIVDSAIDDNTAGGRGGGMEVLGDQKFTMIGSSVQRNHAAGGVNNTTSSTRGGGGLFVNFAAVNAANSEWLIRGSTIANNTSRDDGGGIYVINSNTIQGYGNPNTSARLRVEDSYITGNTAGRDGGGFFAFDVELVVENSVIAGNKASGTTADRPGGAIGYGGGIIASQTSNVQLLRTVVRDNLATGVGGGIAATRSVAVVSSFARLPAYLSVRDSLIEGNVAGQSGGGLYIDDRGIHGQEIHSLVNVTIAGNSAGTDGGGICAIGVAGGPDNSDLQLRQITISGNRARGNGGGLSVSGNAKIGHSTIAGNIADCDGNGVGDFGGLVVGQLFMDHTLVANNLRGEEASDGGGLYFESGYNLVETAPSGQIPNGPGNIVGVDPKLGPLAFNGGPVFADGTRMPTHALLAGSPAIDAGDPAAVAGVNGVPEFDQRGGPWSRVVGGRIDMGAVEWQPNPLAGDYNFNGVVDAADYSVWRDTVGSTNDLRADGSSAAMAGAPDGVVDEHDYVWWKVNFGNVMEQGAGSREPGVGVEQGVVQLNGRSAAVGGVDEFWASEEKITAGESRRVAFLAGVGAHAGVGLQGAGRASTAWQAISGNRAGVVHRDAALLAWVARWDGGEPRVGDAGVVSCEAVEEDGGWDSFDAVFAGLGVGEGVRE